MRGLRNVEARPRSLIIAMTITLTTKTVRVVVTAGDHTMAPTEKKRTETTTPKVIIVLALSRMAGNFAFMMSYSNNYVTY